MNSHIMAVCVVCLLYADHLHCQQHANNLLSNGDLAKEHIRNNSNRLHDIAAYNKTVLSWNSTNRIDSDTLLLPYASSDCDNRMRRRKRSMAVQANEFGNGHEHEHEHEHEHDHSDCEDQHLITEPEIPAITEIYLQRLFQEFGENTSYMHASGFQRLLEQLNLEHLLHSSNVLHDIESNLDNQTCLTEYNLIHFLRHTYQHRDDQLDDMNDNVTDGEMVGIQCVNTTDGCSPRKRHGEPAEANQYTNYTINFVDIVNMCPILMYQLASTQHLEKKGCLSKDQLNPILHIVKNEPRKLDNNRENIVFVWIYAFSSVFACSLLGLVGIAIIPLMESRFYKHIIEFFVALAIGTMTGDALLHLLPHSMAGQDESNMIYKGLTCICGIVCFYITEHSLTMISEWRKSIAKREPTKSTRARVVRDPDSSLNNSITGDKICKSKYSSYPYCYDEIAKDAKNDVWLHLPNSSRDHAAYGHSGKREGDGVETAAQSLLSTSQNNYAPLAEANSQNHNQLNHHHHHIHKQANSHQCLPDGNTMSADLDSNIAPDKSNNALNSINNTDMSLMNDTVTVILREHESTHHGHSHKHGHVHSPPATLGAVVWMIIMGDGLHNFTDGMAIGAAFAENIMGGLSTSLAVFCHELPHELGDFAILIKAGMSVKSAVYYNLLTGILSFIGMIFGIIFGQSHDSVQWMFAVAAGLFIYIAMVDMMPEISAAHKSIQQFALQILGMGSGVLVMFLIAIHEDYLLNIFGPSNANHHSHHNHLHHQHHHHHH